MALIAYCELGEIRAALGANEVELPDAVLSLPVYEIGLVRELNKISVSLPAAFSSVVNTPEEVWTESGQALVDATRLFCVYAAARQVGVSLGVMLPKDVGDGKATLSRFSDSPYKDVLDRIEKMYAATKMTLAETLATFVGGSSPVASTTPPVSFRASGRSYDPVTGV
jgi:hypothetical protein